MRYTAEAPLPPLGPTGSATGASTTTQGTDELRPFLSEDRQPRQLASRLVVRDTHARGPANRVTLETPQGYQYDKDEEPDELAANANRRGRRAIDNESVRRVSRTPIHELYADSYEEGGHLVRPVSDRERQDVGRAMQELIVGRRDELSRSGMLPPRGSNLGEEADDPMRDATPMPNRAPVDSVRGTSTQDPRSRIYRHFEPERPGGIPCDAMLTRAQHDPYVALWDAPERARARQQDALFQALAELRVTRAGLQQTHPYGLSLAEWTFAMRGAGLYPAPASEQPDALKMRQRTGTSPELSLAKKLTFRIYRFALMEERHLKELLQGLSNREQAAREIAIEDAEEDKFRAWIEDHMRTILALEPAAPEPGEQANATPRYNLFAYFFSL